MLPVSPELDKVSALLVDQPALTLQAVRCLASPVIGVVHYIAAQVGPGVEGAINWPRSIKYRANPNELQGNYSGSPCGGDGIAANVRLSIFDSNIDVYHISSRVELLAAEHLAFSSFSSPLAIALTSGMFDVFANLISSSTVTNSTVRLIARR